MIVVKHPGIRLRYPTWFGFLVVTAPVSLAEGHYEAVLGLAFVVWVGTVRWLQPSVLTMSDLGVPKALPSFGETPGAYLIAALDAIRRAVFWIALLTLITGIVIPAYLHFAAPNCPIDFRFLFRFTLLAVAGALAGLAVWAVCWSLDFARGLYLKKQLAGT